MTNRRPRVAIDIQTTMFEKTGIGFYVSNFVRELPKVTPSFDYQFIVPEHVTTDFQVPARWWWSQIEFPRRAHRAGVDLIHQPGFSAPFPSKAKTVVTVHDLISRLFGADIPFWARQYFARWMPFTYRWADHIIADSLHTKRDLQRELGIHDSKITVIYLAAGDEFQPLNDARQRRLEALRIQYGIPGPYLVHIGTLNPRKNLEFLVKVFAQLANDYPTLSLVISGKKGWYYEALFRLVDELKLHDRVIFTGYVTDEDKPILLAGATICAFPSLYEGFGLPPLEAMASGVPVVASSSSSIPEVVGDAGILVDPNDQAGWVDALKRLLDNVKLQREFAAKGLKQAKEFSWRRTAQETAQIYARVLQGEHHD